MSNSLHFNAREIGELTMHLQSICHDCSHYQEGPFCALRADCPIGVARKILGSYMNHAEPVLKDFDISMLPQKPSDAHWDKEKLNSMLLAVHNLCNRCMFHVDKCFINITYALLENALQVLKKKDPSVKPGEKE